MYLKCKCFDPSMYLIRGSKIALPVPPIKQKAGGWMFVLLRMEKHRSPKPIHYLSRSVAIWFEAWSRLRINVRTRGFVDDKAELIMQPVPASV